MEFDELTDAQHRRIQAEAALEIFQRAIEEHAPAMREYLENQNKILRRAGVLPAEPQETPEERAALLALLAETRNGRKR